MVLVEKIKIHVLHNQDAHLDTDYAQIKLAKKLPKIANNLKNAQLILLINAKINHVPPIHLIVHLELLVRILNILFVLIRLALQMNWNAEFHQNVILKRLCVLINHVDHHLKTVQNKNLVVKIMLFAKMDHVIQHVLKALTSNQYHL